MHALMTAAQNEASKPFDVGGLVVPVIAGVVAIVVAIYNTRGETASLRRLKAMNDVIDKLPQGSEALWRFSIARDELARRVALKMAKRRTPAYRRPSQWVIGLTGAAALVGLILAAYQRFPPGYSALELSLNLALGAVVGAVGSVGISQAIGLWSKMRELDRELEAQLSSKQ